MTFAREQNLSAADSGVIADIALEVAALPKENKKMNRIVVITQGKDDVIVAHGMFFLLYMYTSSVVLMIRIACRR